MTFIRLVLNIFFRYILSIRSTQSILKGCYRSGTPVIFAIGAHANQFVDPLIVTVKAGRKIRMLIAKVSTKRRVVNFFARVLNAIPVERPADLKRIGCGFVKKVTVVQNETCSTSMEFANDDDSKSISSKCVNLADGCRVFVEGSGFSAVNVGDIILIKKQRIGVVKCVRSPELMELTSTSLVSISIDDNFPLNYEVIPKVNQSHVFAEVCDSLCQGEAIGIFPEGCSHDNPHLISLKPGVAIMALEALSKYPHLQSSLLVVPVGLNYFHRHKFRSRATVEFGNPIEISHSTLANYQNPNTKSHAVEHVMNDIRQGLLKVTVNAPNEEMYTFMAAACRLFKPNGKSVESVYDRLEVMKKFSEFLDIFDRWSKEGDEFTSVKCEDAAMNNASGKDSKCRSNRKAPLLSINSVDNLNASLSQITNSSNDLCIKNNSSHPLQNILLENKEFLKSYQKQVTSFLLDLKLHGMSIKQLENHIDYISSAHSSTLSQKLFVALKVLLFLPGFFINIPCLLWIRTNCYRKANAARLASTVKVHGIDVVASWKLLLALHSIPLQFTAYCLILRFAFHASRNQILKFVFGYIFTFALFVWLAADISALLSRWSFFTATVWHRVPVEVFVRRFSQLVEKSKRVFDMLEIVVDEDAGNYNRYFLH